MKISPRLEKFVKMAIQQHNSALRNSYDAKVAKAKTEALAKASRPIKHRAQMMEQRAELSRRIEALEKQLTRQGYALEGYHGHLKVAAHDLNKLGTAVPLPELWQETKILMELLAVDEKEGKRLLAQIGVVI